MQHTDYCVHLHITYYLGLLVFYFFVNLGSITDEQDAISYFVREVYMPPKLRKPQRNVNKLGPNQ